MVPWKTLGKVNTFWWKRADGLRVVRILWAETPKTPQMAWESPHTPRALPEPSRSFPDASQMLPSSPLTLDVSKVPSARFRPQNNLLTFYVLENDGRNNCKMLSKMGFQWMHKCVKLWQIVKRIMKKRHLHMKMTKQGETQPLQSLIFASAPTRNRSFNFSIFVEMVSKTHKK